MPIAFSIDSSKKRVYTTVTGPLFEADPVSYVSDVFKHPDYQPGLSTLVVCTKIHLGTFSTAGVRRLASATSGAAPTRVAIVADQLAVYGLVRMYQVLRDPPYELAVFRELSEAEHWLASDPRAADDP